MRTVLALMNRNRKLFFKDKGMLFTSMITPVILICLLYTSSVVSIDMILIRLLDLQSIRNRLQPILR